MKNLIDTKELTSILSYNPLDGTFHLLRNSLSYRQLFPDSEGYLIFFKNLKKYKLKANKIALQLGTSIDPLLIVSKDKVVLHRNLCTNDYRLINLKLITKKQFLQIKEAQRNLDCVLKLQAHPKDVFSYIITWKQDGRDKSLVVQDIVSAKRLLLKLKLKYAKIINRFCVFDI